MLLRLRLLLGLVGTCTLPGGGGREGDFLGRRWCFLLTPFLLKGSLVRWCFRLHGEESVHPFG